MDLLGSIMNSMDKPPSLSEKEKQRIKKRKEELEKIQTEEKEKLKRFQERVDAKLDSHFKDESHTTLKFDPMDHTCRSIVHEVAELKGLLSYAFGEDGVDRYVRVYRRENPPCEDELAARRRGDPWNEQIKQQLIDRRNHEKENPSNDDDGPKRKHEKFKPKSLDYKDKYAHLIGQDAALDAAKKTETNKSYGFVPSENKKDLRSIEQTMADIRAKKRQKTSHNEAEGTSYDNE